MSTTWPCPLKISDCDCADSQIIKNYSAESPDPFTYFSLRYYQGRPPIGSNPRNYITPTSPGICYDTQSPQAANDCALHDAQNRVWAPWTPPRQQFGNQAQQCSIPCPAGPDFVYTIPANTFFSNFSQAQANALARSYCQSRGFPARQCPPIAVTLDAPFVGETSAVLLGSVNPNNEDTIAYFEWGTTTAYGNTTDIQTIDADTSSVQINALITGLSPGVYHYRIVAFNAMGFSEGEDKTFEIVSTCPIDWSLLDWTTPIEQVGLPTGSVSTALGAGSFDVAITGPNAGVQDTSVRVEGRYTYTGDAVPVKLHLEVTVASGSIGDSMVVYHDGSPIFTVPGADLINVGIYDYYFNIPASTAQEILIQQTSTAGSVFPSTGAGQLSTESEISCDCGLPVYQIDGYSDTLAAQLVTLAGGGNPSSKPEWDGKFRLNPDTSTYESTPACYAIGGTDVVVSLTQNSSRAISRHCSSMWVPGIECGWRCNTVLINTFTGTDVIGIAGLGAAFLYNDNAGGLGAFAQTAPTNPNCGSSGDFTNPVDPTYPLGGSVFSVSTV